MFDSTRLYSLLERIEGSIVLILDKTESIKSPDDFLTSSDGMFTLSGVCMQLIFIGENVKVIDNKTDHIYLQDYPEAAFGRGEFVANEDVLKITRSW